jgi:hypothetical protein
MSDDRRNPYVLLGLPYGADLADAQRAFARRSREARWGDHEAVDVGDLTWALEQIEAHHADEAAGYGTFRIPTHPHALEPPAGFGLLRPAPRPAPRQAAPSTDAERAAVYDAARLDAAQQLLDRTAAAVGKRLEHVAETALPQATVAAPPVRRRGWAPVIGVVAAFAAVAAVAGIRTLLHDDEVPATTTVATTAAPEPTTTDAIEESTTTVTTIPGLPTETFGDPIDLAGITITPSDPLDAFEHLCIVFTIEGDVPLGFVRSRVALISDGVVVPPALEIGTGRADITDVFGDASPATREVCFPTADWQAHTTFLEYATDGGSYRWLISDPALPAEG